MPNPTGWVDPFGLSSKEYETGNPDDASSVLGDVSPKIHPGQQGKHIPTDNNYIPGRSTINSGVDPQELLDGAHSGKYPVVGTGSRGNPIVDFGRPMLITKLPS